MSVAQGGKFGNGFASAGASTLVSPMMPAEGNARVIAAAIVGGTISEVTGGKFVNGAWTTALSSALYNREDSSSRQGYVTCGGDGRFCGQPGTRASTRIDWDRLQFINSRIIASWQKDLTGQGNVGAEIKAALNTNRGDVSNIVDRANYGVSISRDDILNGAMVSRLRASQSATGHYVGFVLAGVGVDAAIAEFGLVRTLSFYGNLSGAYSFYSIGIEREYTLGNYMGVFGFFYGSAMFKLTGEDATMLLINTVKTDVMGCTVGGSNALCN